VAIRADPGFLGHSALGKGLIFAFNGYGVVTARFAWRHRCPCPLPFPAQVDFHGDRHITRWRPLVQWLLAIPQLMVASALRSLRQVLILISLFTVLEEMLESSRAAGWSSMAVPVPPAAAL
jgi:hypothetical protein